jgi:hypothetical protein
VAEETPKDERALRLDLFRAAYQLVFGTPEEQDKALREIDHLAFALAHMKSEERETK